jgi:CUG-BP- and ETR3-like factor
MEGCARPLIVKFADNKHQRQQRQTGMYEDKRSWSWEALLIPSFSSSACCLCSSGASSDGHAWASSRAGPHTITTSPIRSRHLWAWCTANSTGHLWPGPGANIMHSLITPTCIHHSCTRTLHRLSMPLLLLLNRESAAAKNPRPREGPAGANLFVYHLPHDLTDADLATAQSFWK